MRINLILDDLIRIESGEADDLQSTPESIQFHVKVETDVKKVYTQIQNILKNYKKEVSGPTLLLVQSPIGQAKFLV